jgi:hypothetical protein
MYFLPNTVEYDGVFAGEAPQLPCNNPSSTISGCAAGQYGEYDNGPNVFNFYDNFNGLTLNPKWTSNGNTGEFSVANGLNIKLGGTNWEFIYAPYASTANIITEALVKANDTKQTELFGEAQLDTFFGGSYSPESLYAAGWNWGPGNYELEYFGPTGTQYTISGRGGHEVTKIYNILGFKWASNGAMSMYTNYTSEESGTNTVFASSSYVELGFYGSTNWTTQWIRIRALPPGGILPAIRLGAVSS